MKALIVVDYQNDFVSGVLGFEAARQLENRIVEKIEEYRREGAMVVFTKDVHDPEKYLSTQEGRRLSIPHCVTDEGSAIYGKVARYANENNTVVKNRFGSEDLCARFFCYPQIDQYELCGILGNMCVLANAVLLKSNYPEARIVVDARCIASVTEEINSKAMDIMEGLQIDVINRSE